MNYWLLKSEPDVYSIEDLKRDKTTVWDNIRNYRARNIMRDEMRPGDLFLFYYSMSGSNGVAGVGEVVEANLPDLSALDRKSEYFDPKASKEKNPWVAITVKYKSTFKRIVGLDEIKKDPRFKDMVLLKIARLSVQPVSESEFKLIQKLSEK